MAEQSRGSAESERSGERGERGARRAHAGAVRPVRRGNTVGRAADGHFTRSGALWVGREEEASERRRGANVEYRRRDGGGRRWGQKRSPNWRDPATGPAASAALRSILAAKARAPGVASPAHCPPPPRAGSDPTSYTSKDGRFDADLMDRRDINKPAASVDCRDSGRRSARTRG